MRLDNGAVPADPHPQETRRLNELRHLSILDTAPEQRFDRLTRLVSRTFDVPIVLISLVDEYRQWFKSRVGLTARETHRDLSFCAHALNEQEDLIIEDALQDPRFVSNPLVTGPPHIRFYAGALIRASNGLPLGTLCLIDDIPRRLSPHKRELLHEFATFLSHELTNDLTLNNERNDAKLRNSLDPLTHYLYPGRFMERIDEFLNDEVHADSHYSLVMVDLPNLEQVRARYGIDQATKVTIEASRRLRQSFRGHGLLFGRLGNTVMAVLFEAATPAGREQLVERAADALHGAYDHPEDPFGCAPRLNWLSDCRLFERASHIISHMQYTLEHDSVAIPAFHQIDAEHHRQDLVRSATITRLLPQAFREERIALAYQPVYALGDNSVSSLEARIGWYDTELGEVTREEIVDACERLNLTEAMDRWVLTAIAGRIAACQRKKTPCPSIAFNVSRAWCIQADFSDSVVNLLNRHGISPNTLIINLPENILAHTDTQLKRHIRSLATIGVRFSLSDFGLSHAPLFELLTLPISSVQLPRQWADKLQETQAAISSTLALAHSAQWRVVAPGIDNDTQKAQLLELGCDEGQGDVFAPALSFDDAIDLVRVT
ncbi:EAL domain-containing protein [Larsenimonas suaedae]|uniref:Sensor domain-containing phosphodiesterase n=1 Tax=Larsenimonas suaedae TaxID=1851019 RepID=A0ABU1GSN2_9GAMM|nr:sensor domain-containing phosphodiesterase [Larsenimonas suaedae]MDR5895043.1 sensor domain-containing phosphodiesterase [Larsenimonas suaedae]